MGTDIHFFVEKRVEGEWILVHPELVECQEEIDIQLECATENHAKALRELYARHPGRIVATYEDLPRNHLDYWEAAKHPFYVSRHYALFSILAGIRNGHDITPISEPKGIPEDASSGYAWEVDYWELDGHSHSWLTLQELIDFDWNQTITLKGYLWPEAYKSFLEGSKVFTYAEAVNTRCTILSNEEMAKLLQEEPECSRLTTFTHLTWSLSYAEECKHFVTKTIPALQELEDPSNVRICFFFDC